jgi:ribosome biogenesis protein Tsr3
LCLAARAFRPWLSISNRKDRAMTTRMASSTVTFQRAFMLNGLERVHAAGAYTVETEETQTDDLPLSAWKPTCTIIHLKDGVTTQYQKVDPGDLKDALARDAAPEDAASTNPSRSVRRKQF